MANKTKLKEANYGNTICERYLSEF
ncbi:MAG: hypothetical protein RLZ33_2189, partial [Bacteroidota bacterium]